MKKVFKGKAYRTATLDLSAASSFALEAMEVRVMMSVTSPASQAVAAGSSVSFTAGDTATHTTVQWYGKAPAQAHLQLFPTVALVSGATSNTLTINPATEALTGYQYEAQFNSTPADDTVPATLTVTGTPITAWNFTAGVGSPASGGTNYGSGNSPATTLNNVSGSPSANAQTLGLTNDYAGVKAFSESDILPIRSATNTTFQQYDWRLRSGSGLGPVGGPGSPEGWSQTAPEYDLISAGSTGKFGDAIVPQGAIQCQHHRLWECQHPF